VSYCVATEILLCDLDELDLNFFVSEKTSAIAKSWVFRTFGEGSRFLSECRTPCRSSCVQHANP